MGRNRGQGAIMTDKKPTQEIAKPVELGMSLAKGGSLLPANLEEAVYVAKLIAHSGMVPKQFTGNTGGVLIAIQMGAELGLSPMASVQNIAVINGRPALWGDAVLALVISHPACEDVVEDDLSEITKQGFATCIVKRRGRSPVKSTFSIDDAKKAGLWGKAGPWQQYPARMLKMRARGFALRDAFPDALRGIQVAEEARDIPIDMRADWTDTVAATVPPEQPVEPDAKTNATMEALKQRRVEETVPTTTRSDFEIEENPPPADDNAADLNAAIAAEGGQGALEGAGF